MITINPVKLNSIRPISFGEGNLNNIITTKPKCENQL